MPTSLTTEQVLALAPDTGSARSAKSLASARAWVSAGRSERAAWGECQGSAKDPYRTQVDLSEPAFRCSCPSRKFPCKHGLGLLLLLAAEPAALPPAEPPPWVAEWLATRDRSTQRRAEPREAADETPAAAQRRAAAQARSAEKRLSKVEAGVDELDRWLRDQLRGGLAALQARSPGAFDALAARMVDAQAPGLARRLREAAGAAVSGPGWQERLLEQLAALHLLVCAHRRLAELPPETQADVRAAIGFTQSQEELLAQPGLRDRWFVLGQRVEEDGRLQTQRTWLIGSASARPALVLDFGAGAQPLDRSLVPGTVLDAELVFFPGAAPLRALVRQRHAPPEPGRALPAADIAAATAPYAAALARNPWIERFPLCVGPAGLARAEGDGERWLLVDEAGRALPIAAPFAGAWGLLARSGGRPLALCGEWDGNMLTPLGALIERRYVALRADQ